MCSNPGSSSFRSSLFTFNSRFIAKRTSNKLCGSPQVCLLLAAVLFLAHHFQFHLTRCRILTALLWLVAYNMSLQRQYKITVTKFIHFVFNTLFPCILGFQENKPTVYTTFRTIILPVVLYGCETWSLTLREEHRLRVFENRVLRRVFGPKRDEVTGE